MLTPSIYQQIQEVFLSKVTLGENTSVLQIKYLQVAYGNDAIKIFKGEGQRTVLQEFTLKCLYQKNISLNTREKYGLNQDVTAMVYVSPLELKTKTNSSTFPVNSENGHTLISTNFLGQYYEVERIVPLESFFDGKEYTCVSYRLDLKNTSGLETYV